MDNIKTLKKLIDKNAIVFINKNKKDYNALYVQFTQFNLFGIIRKKGGNSCGRED